MKKLNIKKILLVLSLTLIPTAGFAQSADDRDLSGGISRPTLIDQGQVIDSILTPSKIEILEKSGNEIQVYRIDHAKPLIVDGLVFKSTNLKTDCSYVAQLKETKFEVSQNGTPYEISFNAACGKSIAITFNEDSQGAQALGIWATAFKAKLKLAANVDMAFWNRMITFNWPGDGDYYNWDTVNITDGRKWDVVGHEMGHAIYDQAKIGTFGGGSHKIDLCYSDALAISEGWASYFSAWVSLDMTDPDAKFEYMVPRRAPVQIENVPADVCKGPTSEWRVFSFLWDLNDLHDDGEKSDLYFQKTWNAMLGKHASNMTSFAKSYVGAGISADLVRVVWELNFQTPASF